jgi:ketosteroid isomerase-like protein
LSAEENKALVRRFYQEIDRGNVEAMDELVAKDYIDLTARHRFRFRLVVRD